MECLKLKAQQSIGAPPRVKLARANGACDRPTGGAND
jgi:hypothetical protein